MSCCYYSRNPTVEASKLEHEYLHAPKVGYRESQHWSSVCHAIKRLEHKDEERTREREREREEREREREKERERRIPDPQPCRKKEREGEREPESQRLAETERGRRGVRASVAVELCL